MASKNKTQRDDITLTLQQLQSGKLLSGQQLMELVSAQTLDEELKESLMLKLGINQANLKEVALSPSIIATKVEEWASENAVNAERTESITKLITEIALTNSQTTANLGLAGSFKALMASMGPIGWISLIVSVLPMVVDLFSGLIETAEETTEKFNQVTNSIKNLQNELDTNTENINNIKKQYAELAQGVDKYGNNLSLTDEEYDTFIEYNNQLAQQFPSLVEGYNSNGVAILNLAGGVQEITNAIDELIESMKSAANLTLLETADDDFKTIVNKAELIQDEIDKLKSEANSLPITIEQALADVATEDYSGKFRTKTEAVLHQQELALKGIGSTINEVFGAFSTGEAASQYYVVAAYGADIAEYEYQRANQIASEANSKYQALIKQIEFKQNELSGALATFDKYINAYLSDMGDGGFNYQQIESTMGNAGTSMVEGLIDKLDITKYDKVDDFYKEIDNILFKVKSLGSEENWNSISETIKTLSQDGSNLSLEEFTQSYDKLVSLLKETDLSKTDINNILSLFDYKKLSAKDIYTPKSTADTLAEIEMLSDKFSKLGTALNEFSSDGYVSIKTLNEINKEFSSVDGIDSYVRRIGEASNTSQLKSSISDLVNAYINEDTVLKNLDETNKQLLITQLQRLGVANSQEVVEQKFANQLPNLVNDMKSLNNQTSANAKSLLAVATGAGLAGEALDVYQKVVAEITRIESLEKANQSLKNSMKSTSSKIINTLTFGLKNKTTNAQIKENEKAISDARKNLNKMLGGIDTSAYNKSVNISINTSGLEALGSGSSKSSNEDPYKKYFDRLKHERQLDLKDEKQYLIDLYNYNEWYYKGKTDYLDEYRSNMEEVYEGFKNLYKEDLEADKEALEKKKEASNKYYDDLIDKIKEANKQEDYEEEQTEKRKTILQLKADIDDLLRDGSERAKARARDLQKELAEAEQELFDFEREHARENEIERLEKAKELAEQNIENEIKSIDDKMDTLDSDIKSVRQAIIDYAAARGVTIRAAYATGTSNSAGGWSRINEKGLELIATPDGHGNYVNMLPASKVLTAQQTSTLMALSQGQLPQAMYNSFARSIGAKVNSPAVNNYNQPITINIGDIIVKGNADKSTVADLKKQREDIARIVLETIKPFTR